MARSVTALLLALALALVCAPSVAEDFSCGDPLLDARDGRDYPTVAIGGQCWMRRNLDFGRQVPNAEPRDDEVVEKSCYGNEAEACRVYGGLYTWAEAVAGACPAGWHLPSRGAWQNLALRLGPATAGEQLKAREDHDPPYDGTDAVGFTALPAGSAFRGSFGRQGDWALFWTSTEVNAERAASVQLDRLWYPEPPKYRTIVFDDFYLKENAFSIRCVKNKDTDRTLDRSSDRSSSSRSEDRLEQTSPPPTGGGTGWGVDEQTETPRARVAPGPGRVPRNAGSPPLTGGGTGWGVDGKRPNILCIVCEDITPRLGSYGDTAALTPVLDRLAREGVRFTRMFDVSGVCAPSRAALITGMYPTAIGADNMRTSSADRVGLPKYEAVPPPWVRPYTELLRAAGYYTTNNAKNDYQFKAPITAWDENGRTAHWKHRPEGMPFFSIFNLGTTHESQIWDRANDPVIVPPESVVVPPYLPDTPVGRRDVARVYSNIAVMDREVGELLAEIEEAGLADETIVIFYGDNGGPLPREKRLLFDSGMHVPYLMRFPGGAHAGEVNEDLVSFVDIPATILSLAGVKVPAYMQGRPFWGEQKAAPREYVYGARDRLDEHYDASRAVRDRRFKYVRHFKPEGPAYLDLAYRRQIGAMQELLRLRDEGALDPIQALWFRAPQPREQLFDTLADPYEVHDLAGEAAWAGHLERLRAALEEWIERTGDDPLRSERDLLESMWPGLVQPKTAAPAVSWTGGRVEIECPTEGAAIAYQVDGRGLGPDHWLLYTGPFEALPGSTVSATAIRVGYEQSGTVEFTVP